MTTNPKWRQSESSRANAAALAYLNKTGELPPADPAPAPTVAVVEGAQAHTPTSKPGTLRKFLSRKKGSRT